MSDEAKRLEEPGKRKSTPGRSQKGSLAGKVRRDVRKYIAEHTVAAGETLSDISLKYYKSAARDDWMRIYEANKATIGDSPNVIKAGQVLKIPEK